MRPFKPGQIVKFHTPYPEEDPDQLYVVSEIFFDVDQPRAHIKAIITGLPFPPTNVVLVEDLIIAEPVQASALIEK